GVALGRIGDCGRDGAQAHGGLGELFGFSLGAGLGIAAGAQVVLEGDIGIGLGVGELDAVDLGDGLGVGAGVGGIEGVEGSAEGGSAGAAFEAGCALEGVVA